MVIQKIGGRNKTFQHFMSKTNKGSRKKSYFFSGPATKRDGKGLATKKNTYFWSSNKKIWKNVCVH